MKEIIYIQAGRLSNFVGTHFWNAQESYFTYEEGDDSYVDHDVSFREGQTLKGEATYCPRLLLFDRKSNFGALSNGLYGTEDDGDAPWNGRVDEFRQPAARKSKYLRKLEDNGAQSDGDDDSSDIRYWSDYSNVLYHPRTPQRLPDVADYENRDGDWSQSMDEFTRYNEETDLMEDSFRFLVEECDNMQGLQIMYDTTSFGGFTHSFLNAVRDEFTKLPCWTFSMLSDVLLDSLDVDNPRLIRKALNDALGIRSLNELSTLSIPIQSPMLWQPGPWLDGLSMKRNSLYHSSSILATHIEDVTLPFRLKHSQDTLFSATSLLTARANQTFVQLSGAFPMYPRDRSIEAKLYDLTLSSSKIPTATRTGSCIDVSRGFSIPLTSVYQEWRSHWSLGPHYISAPAITLPASFPGHLASPTSAFTSLTTTTQTSVLFARYAKLADDCTKQYSAVVQQMGLETDDIKELRDELRALEDEYRGDEQESGGDSLGEDED